MTLIQEIVENAPVFCKIRRDIHAYPELGYDVHRTADLVAQLLTDWGFEVTRGVGRTGVVATLSHGSGHRSIGLRADMDALPMHEANTFAHASTVAGCMHACGHDGHTAMLLAAAHHLGSHRNFDGIVRLVFQPAEEAGGGAKAMIDDGLFERFPMDRIFGIHNWPGLPTGVVALRKGPLMASSSRFRIDVKGRGAHAALPHEAKDAAFVSMEIAGALQGLVSREIDAIDPAVLSVTQIHAGEAFNSLPEHAWLGGTVRTLGDDALATLEARVRKICTALSAAYDYEVALDFQRNVPATVNDARLADWVADVADTTFGVNQVVRDMPPTMTAEDFSWMLQKVPGVFLFLGNGARAAPGIGGDNGCPALHSPNYDFNDAILPVGATLFVRLVESYLA